MTTPEVAAVPDLSGIKDGYEYGFHDPENYAYKAKKALEHFDQRPMPIWAGGHMDAIDFQNIHYFVRASEKQGRTWDEVPADIKNTFDKLGIPEAERKYLAGVGA